MKVIYETAGMSYIGDAANYLRIGAACDRSGASCIIVRTWDYRKQEPFPKGMEPRELYRAWFGCWEG